MKILAAVAALVIGLKLAAAGYPVMLLLAVVAAAILWCGGGAPGAKGAPVAARMHMERVEVRTEPGHSNKVTALHEAGHRRYAKARGWRVESTQVFRNGSGVTVVWVPRDAPVAEKVGIAVAGATAAGTSSGCGSDYRYRDQVLSTIPGGWLFDGPERAAERRAGERLARQAVGPDLFGPKPGVAADAAALIKNGRING